MDEGRVKRFTEDKNNFTSGITVAWRVSHTSDILSIALLLLSGIKGSFPTMGQEKMIEKYL